MSICRGLDEIQNRYVLNADNQNWCVDFAGLAGEMLAQLERNWLESPRNLHGRGPSAENWRLEKRLHLAAHNTSAEKTLEKAIARNEGWYNQIPTASGLFDAHSDKLRNIDLVHRIASNEFEFVELKVASNTPVYAAIEVLSYAVLYLFALRNYTEHDIEAKVLLQADVVHWIVLAPVSYYSKDGANLELERRVSAGLGNLAAALGVRCSFTFGFRAFPRTFAWPCDQEQLRVALENVTPLSER